MHDAIQIVNKAIISAINNMSPVHLDLENDLIQSLYFFFKNAKKYKWWTDPVLRKIWLDPIL